MYGVVYIFDCKCNACALQSIRKKTSRYFSENFNTFTCKVDSQQQLLGALSVKNVGIWEVLVNPERNMVVNVTH